jgi:hypothetical protein
MILNVNTSGITDTAAINAYAFAEHYATRALPNETKAQFCRRLIGEDIRKKILQGIKWEAAQLAGNSAESAAGGLVVSVT